MKPKLLEPTQTFDITLKGFDAGTRAHDEAQLERWLKSDS